MVFGFQGWIQEFLFFFSGLWFGFNCNFKGLKVALGIWVFDSGKIEASKDFSSKNDGRIQKELQDFRTDYDNILIKKGR